jgi:hypothetical protein
MSTQSRKKIRIALAVAAIAPFIAGIAVIAQAQSSGCPKPSGSYQSSCTVLSCDEMTLTAKCKRKDGSWNPKSVLSGYGACSNDISNCDGNLRCMCGSDCPGGSYKGSCDCCGVKNANYNSNTDVWEQTLTCQCKNKKGKYVTTELPYFTGCKKDENGNYQINNNNGSLTCAR